ncbi:MAG: radical SAM protein [Thermoguttaceae bacterium]
MKTCTAKNAGTKEWAARNVNIITGCSHNCRYCYAHSMARRFGRVKDWSTPVLRDEKINSSKANGPIMFPSTHDIEPAFLQSCMAALGKLLASGNQVLIVSKPHLECVERICTEFVQYRTEITFRFSIGSLDSAVLKFWEPGAPSFEERLACLQRAIDAGYQTSVSAEPMLDARAIELFHRMSPFVTDKVWIGKLNRPRNCIVDWEQIDAEIRQIEANQTVDRLLAIYKALKNERKVAWKDSFASSINLN